jgi:hypothetical protein
MRPYGDRPNIPLRAGRVVKVILGMIIEFHPIRCTHRLIKEFALFHHHKYI